MRGTLSPPSYTFVAYTGQNLPLMLGTITLQDLELPQWYFSICILWDVILCHWVGSFSILKECRKGLIVQELNRC
jgi:hypothetical protein